MSVRDDILAYLRTVPGGSARTISEDLILPPRNAQAALDDLHAAGEITEYGGWYRAVNEAGRKLFQQQTALTKTDLSQEVQHGCPNSYTSGNPQFNSAEA